MLTPVFPVLKRLLVGRPPANAEQEHQRLSRTIALAALGYLVPTTTRAGGEG